MFRLISGIFMGWALGSNDSANVFGTAVFSRSVRFRTAVILVALFVILGAYLEGRAGIDTLTSLVSQTTQTAFVASLAAALTVTLMSILKLPVSTSQAAVGAILGIGAHVGGMDLSQLGTVVAAWIATPIGAAVATMILYPILGYILEHLRITIFARDRLVRAGILIAGSYGAYALGANNVANVTGIYAGTGLITVTQAALIGGVSIAIGALTYSRNVMMTVGQKLVQLDPFTAFVAVLSEAIVVHVFAKVGVPVSTSQAIVGAILGIGLLKGVQTINRKTLFQIVFGWVGTPLVAFAISALLFFVLV